MKTDEFKKLQLQLKKRADLKDLLTYGAITLTGAALCLIVMLC